MPLFAIVLSAAPASAATTSFQLIDANTIQMTLDGNQIFNLTKKGDKFVDDMNYYTITNVTKSGANAFTGTLDTAIVGVATGVVQIADPSNVGASTAVGAAVGTSTTDVKDPNGATAVKLTCDGGAGGFSWLLCGIISHMFEWIDWVRDNIIVPFLKEPMVDKNSDNYSQVYAVWSTMRNIASVLLILVFLLVIFGTAIGFDNYTIKKIMPHLVAGAILMPLSWYLCAIGVDFGNVLGGSVIQIGKALITPPQVDFTTPMTSLIYGPGSALLGLTGVVALTQLTFFVGVSVVISFLVIFFTLVWRQVLIIFLIVASPFAFLAYVLPNTQKYFRTWWTNLLKMILIYPLYLGIIEVARLFASVIDKSNMFPHFVPLIQLALLGLVPAIGLSWAMKVGGGQYVAMGQKAFQRGFGEVDKRWGKDSDRGKAAVQNRKMRWSRRAEGISTLGKKIERRAGQVEGGAGKRGLAWIGGKSARIAGGIGSGVAGTRAGSDSFGFGEVGKHNKAKDLEAGIDSKAKIKTAKVNAHEDIDPETGTFRTVNKKIKQRVEAATTGTAVAQGKADALSEAILDTSGGPPDTMGGRLRQKSQEARYGGTNGLRQVVAQARQGTLADARIGAHQNIGNMHSLATTPGAPTGAQLREGAEADKNTELFDKYGGLAGITEHFEKINNEVGQKFGMTVDPTTGRLNEADMRRANNLRLEQTRATGFSNARNARMEAAAKTAAKARSDAPTFAQGFQNQYDKASLETADNDGKTIGNVEGMESEVSRLVDESGGHLSRDQARQSFMRSAGQSGRNSSKQSFVDARGKEAGVNIGTETAIDDLIKKEKDDHNPIPGRTVQEQRDEASRRILNSASRRATANTATETGAKLGQAVGEVESLQESAIQTAAETLAARDGLTKDAALGIVRGWSDYAKGSGVNNNIVGSIGARQVIQQGGAQRGRQEAYKSSLATYETNRKTATADQDRVRLNVQEAVNADVEAAEIAARAAGTPLTPAQVLATRTAAERTHNSATGIAAVRNRMSGDIVKKAGDAAIDKVNKEYNDARSATIGDPEGRALYEEDLIGEQAQTLINQSGGTLNPNLARQQAENHIRNTTEGRQLVQDRIQNAKNKSQTTEGAKQVAAGITQPRGQLELQDAAAAAASRDERIERETDRLMANAARTGRGSRFSREQLRVAAARRVDQATTLGAPPVANIVAASTAAQANAAAIRVTARAKGEQARRNQAVQESGDIALNTAADNTESDILLDVQTRAAEANQAKQEGAIAARANEPHVDYEHRRDLAEQQELDKIDAEAVDAVMRERMVMPDPAGGTMEVALKDGDMSETDRARYYGQAEDALRNGNYARMAAFLKKLGSTDSGRQEIRRFATAHLGRTADRRRVINKSNPEFVRFYNQVLSGINLESSPDLRLGMAIIGDGLTQQTFRKLDKGAMAEYAGFIHDNPASVKLQTEAIGSINSTLGADAHPNARSNFEQEHYDSMRRMVFATNNAGQFIDPATGRLAATGADLVELPLPFGTPPLDPVALAYLRNNFRP